MEKLHLNNSKCKENSEILVARLGGLCSSSFWFARTSKEEQEGKKKVRGEAWLQEVIWLSGLCGPFRASGRTVCVLRHFES